MSRRALRRSLSDFKRHPWLHFISISTIMVALLIQGGFLLCYRNFDALADHTNPRVTGTVYLLEGQTETQVQELREKILSQTHVNKVVFKSRESVVKELQAFLGGSQRESMPGSELFPDVLELELSSQLEGSAINQLKQVVARLPGVAEVDFSEDWLMQYKKVRHFLTIFGVVFIIAMVIGCSFIIANFMSMRHQSRKYEIDVVRLIGGQGQFILSPFLWEALIEGVIGTFSALGCLYLLQLVAGAALKLHGPAFFNGHTLQYLSIGQIGLVFVMGLAMAFFGSITVFLRFRESSH